jgi:hypothetical protein
MQVRNEEKGLHLLCTYNESEWMCIVLARDWKTLLQATSPITALCSRLNALCGATRRVLARAVGAPPATRLD